MINNHNVHLIIKEKLRLAGGSSIADRLGGAFDLITYDRENNHQGDLDYAAAEHYLFSRWLIFWTGPLGYPFLAGGAGAYALVKKLLPNGVLQKLKFGDGPVTPYASGDVQWSIRGANDGLIDFGDAYMGVTVPQDPPDPS